MIDTTDLTLDEEVVERVLGRQARGARLIAPDSGH